MTRAVFNKIRREELVRLTQKLVRIPSVNPPGNEIAVAEALAQEMRSYGFASKLAEVSPKRTNAIATYSGKKKGRVILLNGHMDVVPVGNIDAWKCDPFSATLSKGRIYGRGSVDMKGGLAAVAIACKAFVEEHGDNFEGSIILTGVVDEESAGLGTKHLVENGIKAHMAVIAEPSDGTIYRAHKGVLWFKVGTKGHSIHSSRVTSKGTENAIYKMSKVVSALQNYLLILEKRKNALVGNPTISVGVIEGGTKANVVPDTCMITVDRRLLPNESPKKALGEIQKILSELSQKDRTLKMEVEVILEREGAIVGSNENIVKITKEAVKEVVGKSPKVTGCIATTDMAFLVNQGKIPTVVYGPGSLQQAHVVDEYIEVDELVKASKVYASILERVLCR